jgi:hypothetical protein
MRLGRETARAATTDERLDQDRRSRRLNLLRDLAKRRLGRLDVLVIEERSDERSLRAAEQQQPAYSP